MMAFQKGTCFNPNWFFSLVMFHMLMLKLNIYSRIGKDYSCFGYIFNGKLCFATFPSNTTNGS